MEFPAVNKNISKYILRFTPVLYFFDNKTIIPPLPQRENPMEHWETIPWCSRKDQPGRMWQENGDSLPSTGRLRCSFAWVDFTKYPGWWFHDIPLNQWQKMWTIYIFPKLWFVTYQTTPYLFFKCLLRKILQHFLNLVIGELSGTFGPELFSISIHTAAVQVN